jgi:hypothetical protein
MKRSYEKAIIKSMTNTQITLMLGFLDDVKKAHLTLKDAIRILRECRDKVEHTPKNKVKKRRSSGE